jgi:hypothetical protein
MYVCMYVCTVSQKVKNLIKQKHREYLKNIETSFYDNPKVFRSYHKAMTHKRRDLNLTKHRVKRQRSLIHISHLSFKNQEFTQTMVILIVRFGSQATQNYPKSL